MKNFIAEKKQLNEIIHKKNVEIEKLKKENQSLENNLDQTIKEYEEITNLYNSTVLE